MICGAPTTEDSDGRPSCPQAASHERLDLRAFFSKWWPSYTSRVFPRSTIKEGGPPTGGESTTELFARMHTQRSRGVWVLNLSRFVLKPAGFLLVLWLLTEPFLDDMFGQTTADALIADAAPVVLIGAPAVVGYWTNFIAIKMLFRPRRPNMVWQGLIPKRKPELAQLMAQGIKEQLISPEIIRAYLHETGAVREFLDRNVDAIQGTISDPRFKQDLVGLANRLAEEYLTNASTQEFVDDLVERFVNKAKAEGIKGKLILWLAKRQKKDLKKFARDVVPQFVGELDEILEGIDVLLEAIPPRLKDHTDLLEEGISDVIARSLEEIDVAKIIRAQVDKMDEEKLEEMMIGRLPDELEFVQTAGGIFGLLVGLSVTFPPLRIWMLVVVPLAVWATIVATTKRGPPARPV